MLMMIILLGNATHSEQSLPRAMPPNNGCFSGRFLLALWQSLKVFQRRFVWERIPFSFRRMPGMSDVALTSWANSRVHGRPIHTPVD